MVSFLKKEITKLLKKETDERVLNQIYLFLLDYKIELKGDKGKFYEIEKFHKLNNLKVFNMIKDNVNLKTKISIIPYQKSYEIALESLKDDDIVFYNEGVTSSKIVDNYIKKHNKLLIELTNYKFWNSLFEFEKEK